MSYEKNTWATGDIITAEKLNNLENGVASGGEGGIFVVRITRDDNDPDPIYDKSWREIKNAYDNNMLIMTKEEKDKSSDSVIDLVCQIGFITIIEWYENGDNKWYMVQDSWSGESRGSLSPDEWIDP